MRQDEPRERDAARVVVIAPSGTVLLFRGGDPYRPDFVVWHTPGGGLDEDESYADAAVRELREETGLRVDREALEGPVWERWFDFLFAGVSFRQHEIYYVHRVDAEFVPDTSGFEAWERLLMTEHVWWDDAQLRDCPDLLAPPDLADRLAELLAHGVPAAVVQAEGGTAIDGTVPAADHDGRAPGSPRS